MEPRRQYVTGGSIRDVLLDREPKDIDFVWCYTTPEYLESLNMKKVGAAFPIFLDVNGNEHALARRERKTGVGYHGFECETNNVSIEEDLGRRDLSCNSLAVQVEDWDEFKETKDESFVIDPFGGIADLRASILRHTSEAYAEDAIRVLRTARFSARYNFKVHPDTIELMRKIVPELDTVPRERIWAEFEKGLMEEHPTKMFEVLYECGALHNRRGALVPYSGVDLNNMRKVQPHHDLYVRFGLMSLFFDGNISVEYRIPSSCALIAKTFNACAETMSHYLTLTAEERVRVLEKLKAFNHLWLFNKCVEIFEFYDQEGICSTISNDQHTIFMKVNQAAIAAGCSNGNEIREKIFKARVEAIINS